jgi:methyl-accepting chemotaxis protein
MIQKPENHFVPDIIVIRKKIKQLRGTGPVTSGEQVQRLTAEMSTDQRLDRIEEKIDRLADAMIDLARAEEKIAALAESQTHHTERLNRLSTKIDDIAAIAADNTRTVQLINKLFWVVMVAAIGAIASNIWM